MRASSTHNAFIFRVKTTAFYPNKKAGSAGRHDVADFPKQLRACNQNFSERCTTASPRRRRPGLGTSEDEPVDALLVRSGPIGNNGGTVSYGFKRMLSEAKTKARRAGANIVKLLEVREPNMDITCYRTDFNFLFYNRLPAQQVRLSRQQQAPSYTYHLAPPLLCSKCTAPPIPVVPSAASACTSMLALSSVRAQAAGKSLS